MSDRSKNNTLVLLGIITALATFFIQVVSVGELKGRVETVIDAHQRTLVAHDAKLDEHTKDISEIKGKLHGIASQVGRVPGKVANALKDE